MTYVINFYGSCEIRATSEEEARRIFMHNINNNPATSNEDCYVVVVESADKNK